MDDKVDAVVIGAGLGGLSAAAGLAREGLAVLLLERHNVPGGYATSFVRGRYEFEVALHELSGIGTGERPSVIYRYMDRLGVTRHVDFLKAPTLYRSIFPGTDVTLPYGWGRCEQELCDRFPDDAGGIRELLQLCRRVGRDLAALRKGGLSKVFKPRNAVQLPFRHPTLFRYNQHTWDQVLRRYVKGRRARGVLSQLWGYFGLPPSRCSFFFFAIGLASYIRHGAAYVKGRSQALSTGFLRAFEEHGGRVRMGTGVSRILLEGGEVAGVVTDDGQQVRADYVVSNADPMTTCRDLIGRDHVPRSFFRSLQPSTVATSTVNVYLGVARTARELGIDDHETFINDDFEFERHYAEGQTLDDPSAIVLTTYNHVWPEISPPGTSMVVLTSLKFGSAFHGIDPERYVEIKHRIADAMIRKAERVAPDLRRHAEVVEVSTPVTNMRFAGALGGSIYGFNNDPGRHTIWRTPVKGPLPGLYFAGAWTMPGGGFEPVIISGELAAGAIIGRRRKQAEVAP